MSTRSHPLTVQKNALCKRTAEHQSGGCVSQLFDASSAVPLIALHCSYCNAVFVACVAVYRLSLLLADWRGGAMNGALPANQLQLLFLFFPLMTSLRGVIFPALLYKRPT